MAVEHVHDRLNGVELELLVALELDFHRVRLLLAQAPRHAPEYGLAYFETLVAGFFQSSYSIVRPKRFETIA